MSIIIAKQMHKQLFFVKLPGEFGIIADEGIGGLESISLVPLLCCCTSEVAA